MLVGSTPSASDENVFQNLHWGLELVLKGYLQAQGWPDARCRVQLGHDIAAALAAAERVGLGGISARARQFVGALSPYSRHHRVHDFVAAHAGDWLAADAILLAESIARQVKITTRTSR